MFQKKKKMLTPEQAEEIRIQEFFDRIVPSTVRFFTDHFICGNSYKCVWAVREWPTVACHAKRKKLTRKTKKTLLNTTFKSVFYYL